MKSTINFKTGATYQISDEVYTGTHENLASRCWFKKVKIVDILEGKDLKPDKIKIEFLEHIHGGLKTLVVSLDMIQRHIPDKPVFRFKHSDIGKKVSCEVYGTNPVEFNDGILRWVDDINTLNILTRELCGVEHKNGMVLCHIASEVTILN